MVVAETLFVALICHKKDTSCRTFIQIMCEEKQLQNGVNIFTRGRKSYLQTQSDFSSTVRYSDFVR